MSRFSCGGIGKAQSTRHAVAPDGRDRPYLSFLASSNKPITPARRPSNSSISRLTMGFSHSGACFDTIGRESATGSRIARKGELHRLRPTLLEHARSRFRLTLGISICASREVVDLFCEQRREGRQNREVGVENLFRASQPNREGESTESDRDCCDGLASLTVWRVKTI